MLVASLACSAAPGVSCAVTPWTHATVSAIGGEKRVPPFSNCTSEKLVDAVFVLTDRKSLDTNIREDIEKFTHLKDVVGLARKAEDLPRFLKELPLDTWPSFSFLNASA